MFGKELHTPQKLNLEKIIISIESVIATLAYSGGIFLSIFATASLVPTMLEKGQIELILSKPISRSQILFGRFVGAQAIMFFNVVYLIGGSWLILSMKTGFWYFPYLYAILMVMVAFAAIYALMTFVGVTTRSTGVSIMMAYAVLFFSPLLAQKDRIYAFLSHKIYYYLLEGLYQILPKTFELGEMNQALVMGKAFGGWTPLWSSCLAAFFIYLFANYIFVRKNF
ncbi:MAG: hypothetical protein D6813_08530 [Calditrichaeota bacterium]|nr:MAG: hypothetical protein D6813_08530 [Calditrichota bacterium]